MLLNEQSDDLYHLKYVQLMLQQDYLENINYDMSYKRLKKELIETFNLNSQIAFEKFINKNYREKVTSTALIQDCISAMDIGLGSLSQNLPQTQFDNYKIYGYPQSELEKICKPLGINFSIQNNLIQVTSVDEKFEGTDTLIFNKENSGKIQKKGRDEIVILTGLTPGVNPNDWIQCEFDEFKGTARVKEVYHHGNNYGQTCVTEITIGYKNND